MTEKEKAAAAQAAQSRQVVQETHEQAIDRISRSGEASPATETFRKREADAGMER